MHLSTVSEWLSWMASLPIAEIELGLDRVREVAARLPQLQDLSFACPIITVGGTNGKGSTVAGLEAIYRAAGYHVGAFTSPFLFKHNEQIRIDGREVSDDILCHAFEQIEIARKQVLLTPFEFFTLSALLIFKQRSDPLDVLLLEVGLGGRLDAVNIIDANIAIVTSIDIDHVDWLGLTREEIAREKAGIFRAGHQAICGDQSPPLSLIEYAAHLGSPLFCQGKDFSYQENIVDWSWEYQTIRYDHLPLTTLATQNMAIVLMAITLLQDLLPVQRETIEKGLSMAHLPGRIEVMSGAIMEIYDVSHNPAAIAFLAKRLKNIPCYGKTHAVFSMLADKDIAQSIRTICDIVDHWYIAPLPIKRAATGEMLLTIFHQAEINEVTLFSTIEEAYNIAKLKAQLSDRIIIFGSFHTVAEIQMTKKTAILA